MDSVQQSGEEQKKQGEDSPVAAVDNNNKRKASRPKKRPMPLTEDQRIDRIEQFKKDAMREIKGYMDMEIDFKMPDEDLDKIVMKSEDWKNRALRAEQLANAIIDYEDAECDVEALREGNINKFVPVERITIFDSGYEPLNQKLTAFVNAPMEQMDHDFYRRLEHPMDVHQMVLDVRAEGKCPLIEEIFCDNKKDTDRYGKYFNFLVDIVGRVNKRIKCKLMERVIEMYSALSAKKKEEEKEKSKTNGENAVGNSSSSAAAPIEPSDDLNLFRFQQINPDEIHRSVMQQIKTGIELGILENNTAPQLELLDDPKEVNPGEDDVCDLEQTHDDDIQELDGGEKEESDADECDNDDEDGKENGVVPNLPGAGIIDGAPPDQKAVDGAIVVGGDDDVIELSSGGASDAEEDVDAFWNETAEEDNAEYWHDEDGEDEDDGAGYDPEEIMVVDEAFNDKNSSLAGSDVITLD